MSGLACFFTFMTVAEGGGKRAVQRKFQDIYVPALKANWLVWPTVQLINFRVMPIQYQIVCMACKYPPSTANSARSLSSLPWVSLGQRTSPSQTPQKKQLRKRCMIFLVYHWSLSVSDLVMSTVMSSWSTNWTPRALGFAYLGLAARRFCDRMALCLIRFAYRSGFLHYIYTLIRLPKE